MSILQPVYIKSKVKDCERRGYIYNLEGPNGPGFYLDTNYVLEIEAEPNLKLLDLECSKKHCSIEIVKNLIKIVKPEKIHIISVVINNRYDVLEILLPHIKNLYEINQKHMVIQLKSDARYTKYNRPIPIILGPEYQKFIKEYEMVENKNDPALNKLKVELENLRLEGMAISKS